MILLEKKLVFVTPWYGQYATGGAETICKTVAEHLSTAGFQVEVFTTCSKQFLSGWTNDYKPGKYVENGLLVRRFKIDSRDVDIFNSINSKILSGIPLSKEEEENFFRNNINSKEMMDAIEQDSDSIFVFIPYLYGTTFFGCQIHPERSLMIPCLHDEGYAKMKVMQKALSQLAGISFNSMAEKIFAESLLDKVPFNKVIGTGIDQGIMVDPMKFKKKYNLEQFILYGGRKDAGKNVPLLIDYFCRFLEKNNTDLKLVLLGNGKAEIPEKFSKNIIDMTVPKSEWYDACATATIFCLPSINESFSIVIMEAWLQKTPILVHNKCEVTKEHCLKSNGGLYFDNYEEFEACVKYYLKNPETRERLGENGYQYVLSNFTWDKIMTSFSDFIKSILEPSIVKG